MQWIADPDAWLGLLTPTVLELVLQYRSHRLGCDPLGEAAEYSAEEGVDDRTQSGHVYAHFAAANSIWLIIGLTRPLFSIGGFDVTGRTLILVSGGLFLFAKSTHEIHDRVEGEEEKGKAVAAPSLIAVVSQIILLDAVFSLDSVITAVGMVDEIAVMIIAVIVAVIVMMIFAAPIVRRDAESEDACAKTQAGRIKELTIEEDD